VFSYNANGNNTSASDGRSIPTPQELRKVPNSWKSITLILLTADFIIWERIVVTLLKHQVIIVGYWFA